MLRGFIDGIIIAYLLSLFDIDKKIINFSKEVLRLTVSESTYYVVSGLIGLIFAIFSK